MENMTFDTPQTAWRLERLNAGRLKDLEILHTAVYGKAPEQHLYRKKYDTAYTGLCYVGYLAYSQTGEAAAYYGVVPCFARLGDRKVLAAQSVDTMTHPSYRKRGLFVLLCQMTIELSKTEGIRFLFGFPNEHSYTGFVNNLGWTMAEKMHLFILPVPARPLTWLSRKLLRALKLYRSYTRQVLKKYLLPHQGLSNMLLSQGYDGLLRDEPYLHYKTYHPTGVVAIGKAAVWIGVKATLFIGDIDTGDENFEDIIKGLEKIARRLGLEQMSFQTSPDTPLDKLFAANYTSIPSFPTIFYDLQGGLNTSMIKFTFADVDIF